jgi:adenylate cyclase, class 2
MNMTSTDNLEVEVKFLVDDLAAFRRKLLAAGAELIKARVYERNVRFDTADDSLLQNLELLRLRQDNIVRITFKGPTAAEKVSEAKVREELEVQVSDFEAMAAIFQRLGFQPQQTYEKYRETFQIKDVEIVLDELPFGDFIELEGEETQIRKMAGHLGLEWENRILTNYLALMGLVKELYNLPFDDLTFNNFANQQITLRNITHLQ